MVIARLDVAGRNRACRRHDIQRDIFATLEHLGRRQPRARDRVSIPDPFEPNKPRFLFEHERMVCKSPKTAGQPHQMCVVQRIAGDIQATCARA